MGFYLNQQEESKPIGAHGKAQALKTHYGAVFVPSSTKFTDIPDNKAFVVVVDNGLFEAAALAYNEAEFDEFTDASDTRPRQYLLMDKEAAHKLASYEEPT